MGDFDRAPQAPIQPGEAVLSCGHQVAYSPLLDKPDNPANPTRWLELCPAVDAGGLTARWAVICLHCLRQASDASGRYSPETVVRAMRTHWHMPRPEATPLQNMHALGSAGPEAIRDYLSTLSDEELLSLGASMPSQNLNRRVK